MSHSNAKTVSAFIIDGQPTGMKEVSVDNWSGLAYIIPRSQLLDSLHNRPILQTQSVYFLIGNNEDDEEIVYVGEAEDFSKRIKNHHQKKDFWNVVIAFFSQNGSLTKSHIRYLEAKFYRECAIAKRVKIDNGKAPQGAKLNESEEHTVNSFAVNCRLILGTYRYTFLEQVTKQHERLPLICAFKGHVAKAVYTGEGLTVLAGSDLAKDFAQSADTWVRNLRKHMTPNLVVGKGDILKLKKDRSFSNPSAASSFVLARTSNGWTEWTDEKGNTLDEIKRKGV